MQSAIVSIIETALSLAAPAVARAITGGRTVKEATDDARKAAEAVDELEGSGAEGKWDRGDEVRKERG